MKGSEESLWGGALKTLYHLLAVVSVFLVACIPARSALVLTLQDTEQTVVAGQATTLHFWGTLTNSGTDAISGARGSEWMVPYDRTRKLGLPFTALSTNLWSSPFGAGESYVGEIFSFSVAPDAKPARYEAYCRIKYYPASQPEVQSNKVYWYVNVVVPEPSPVISLICGIAGLGCIAWRRTVAPTSDVR